MNNKKRIILLLIGPLLLLLCNLLLPDSIFPDSSSKSAIGTIAWMAFWWVTAPVDYAVTAFLPIITNALFSMCDMNIIISNYASETVLLLLGASILTVSWENTGLDKRISAIFLSLIGDNLRAQLIFWFILSAVLSAILPNAVVCATVTPIAISMLKYVGETDIKNSRIGSKLLLTIAYATGVGGLASPLGGAMNLVTVDYLQKLTGQEYMYISWIVRFLPIVLILILTNILFMIRDVKKDESLGGSKEYFEKEYKKFTTMKIEEKLSLALFAIAILLVFARPLYQSFLPGMKPAYVFLICAVLSFLINQKDGTRVMVWKSVQTKIVWELIYVFAGGIAAGALINASGAATILGNLVSNMGLTGGFITVISIITITLLMSDITSNTATAAISIPIVISIMDGINVNPIPFIYIASVGVNLSYILPTSIRAIPVGYGLSPKYMFNEGWKITLMVILTMSITCYLLLKYWPSFSTT